MNKQINSFNVINELVALIVNIKELNVTFCLVHKKFRFIALVNGFCRSEINSKPLFGKKNKNLLKTQMAK